jgi:hypothetical protein
VADGQADHWQAKVAAGLLRQGQSLAALSRLFIALAVAGFVLALAMGRSAWAVPCLLSLAAGGAALWLALRVGLDAELFEALARSPDLQAFDDAMLALGLMPPKRAGRPLRSRIDGALRLLRLQGFALAVQLLTMPLGALILYAIGR